jgi:dATP pyrophosphohydrolase
MTRAPFQVLVLPYRRRADGVFEYALFRRADLGVWQGVAGGGEDLESPEAAAVREAFEEAGIAHSRPFLPLASVAAIPVEHFSGRAAWDPALQTIPEYSFGVEVARETIHASREHSSVQWLEFRAACALLEWQSNRNALCELDAELARRTSGRRTEDGRDVMS